MQIATIGLDLAKNVFQLHAVDAEGRVAVRRRLRRAEVLRFFTGLPPCLVGMEACAGAHYWARTITDLGHEVRLMPPAYVKPYVRRQKNDMADAAAICEAVTRPSMRFVPIKSEAQQAMLLIHRARDLLVRQRTSLINALRAHLAEFGVVVPKGAPHGRQLALMLIEGETFGLPASAVPALQTLARQCQELSEQIADLERDLRQRSLQDETTRRLLQIPGIGPITATALTATIAEPTSFRSAREFAAWIGLVPRQHSSGGHERLGGITKMGHAYLRRLLISGAQAVLLQAARHPAAAGPWLERLLREKPRKVVAVALANKTARIVWALLARGEAYRLTA
jgi:transposase